MSLPDIGDAAQAALQPLRGPGGAAYLDDGRCSGWVTVANTRMGPGNYWSAAQGGVVSSVKCAPGSVCAISDAWNAGQRIFTLTNGSWNLLIQVYAPFMVKPDPTKITPWKTRVRTAVRNALVTSPGPVTTAFSPLAGLPNQYRSR